MKEQNNFLWVYKKMMPDFGIVIQDNHLIIKGFNATTFVSGLKKEYCINLKINTPVDILIKSINAARTKIIKEYGECSTREAIVQGFKDLNLDSDLKVLRSLVDKNYYELDEFGDACIKFIVEKAKECEEYKDTDISFEIWYPEKELPKEEIEESDIELE